MGSAETEPDRRDNETQHPVSLTQGYWLADTACTQALWQAVMGENPSEYKGEERPVERVSWNDIQGFLKKLNKKLAGLELQLPSEAQWEYICRAGSVTAYSWGDEISPERTRYDADFEGRTALVKDYPPSPWGLYQMHGNVWEWCADWLADYSGGESVNPRGPQTGQLRVLRGGSWFRDGRYLRSAQRLARLPGSRVGFSDYAGFRFSQVPLSDRREAPEPSLAFEGRPEQAEPVQDSLQRRVLDYFKRGDK